MTDWQHIDDVCQRTIGSDPSDVATRCLRAGLAFAEAVEGRGLAIAPKSVVVSNLPKLAGFVARELREAGYEVTAAQSTEMLGVRTQLDASRNLTTARNRWTGFKSRVSRISMLSKVTKQAAKLFSSHVSMATYGDASIGTDPMQQKLLMQAGSKAAGRFGFQACPTTVCAIALRELPSVRPVRKLFAWWLRWFGEIQQDVSLVAKLSEAWSSWRDTFRKLTSKERWKAVNGPSQAIMAHMLDWGWSPVYPSWWVKPPCESATVGLSAASDALLLMQVTEAAEQHEWTKAAQHDGSEGLEGGTPSFLYYLAAKKSIEKMKLPGISKALSNTVAGGALLGSRFSPQRKCLRCNSGATESWRHKFYECPGNSLAAIKELFIDLDLVGSPEATFVLNWLEKTDYLEDLGASLDFKPNCWWSRGLLAASMAPEGADCSKEEGFRFVSEYQQDVFCQPLLGTDGTLAKPEGILHPALGRACTGLALVQFDPLDPKGIIGAAIGGYLVEGSQTVPRAEAAGGAKAGDIFGLKPSSVARWVVDADYLYKGCIRSTGSGDFEEHGASSSVHADLWSEIDFALHENVLPMPDKVTSHFGLAQVNAGLIDFQGYLANGIADIAAAITVPMVRASVGAVQLIKDVELQGKHICMRLAVLEWISWKVLHSCSNFDMELPPVQQVLTQGRLTHQLVSDLDDTGHSIVGFLTDGGCQGLRCNLCGKCRRSTRLDWWLKEPCDPVGIVGQAGSLIGTFEPPPPFLRCLLAEFSSPSHAEGTWAEVKAAARAHALHRKEAKAKAKQAEERAASSVGAALASSRVALAGQEPLPAGATLLPGWTRSFHPNHQHVFHAEGLFFCDRCGATASSQKRGRLQAADCDMIAAGSIRRLTLLRRGSLMGVSDLSAWPSGEPKSLVARVYRLWRNPRLVG